MERRPERLRGVRRRNLGRVHGRHGIGRARSPPPAVGGIVAARVAVDLHLDLVLVERGVLMPVRRIVERIAGLAIHERIPVVVGPVDRRDQGLLEEIGSGIGPLDQHVEGDGILVERVVGPDRAHRGEIVAPTPGVALQEHHGGRPRHVPLDVGGAAVDQELARFQLRRVGEDVGGRHGHDAGRKARLARRALAAGNERQGQRDKKNPTTCEVTAEHVVLD
jgi:hypothetical protein